MGMDVRQRFQKTVDYQSDAQETVDLGRGLVLRELVLRLRAQPTLTAANNLGDDVARGDAWGVVKKIELLINNDIVIRSMSGNELWWLNYFMFGCVPPVSPTLGDDDGAGNGTANPSLDVCLILPMWSFRSIRPMDTALDTRLLSDFKMRITWGSYTDIHSDASAWTAEPTLDVHSNETAGTNHKFLLQRIYSVSRTITADDERFQIKLATGDAYRGFLINTTDAGVDEGDILNNLKIISGATQFYDSPGALIKQYEGWLHPGIGHPIANMLNTAGSGPVMTTNSYNIYNKLQRSDSSNQAGWYFIDLVKDGYLSDSIDTYAFTEFLLECDVSVGAGTTKINVLPITLTPNRNQ